STDKPLQQTGIWVALHHLDWADIVVDFLKKHLHAAELTTEEQASINNLMVKFSSSVQIQYFISSQLDNRNLALSKRLFLIDVINHSDVRKLPEAWVKQLGNLLRGNDHEIRSEVLNLIKSRSISTLNNE